MVLPADFPFFTGDPDNKTAEKPGSWLKRLERTWTSTTIDADKIHDFSTSLDADSIAETWWDRLDPAHKATWADVKRAFIVEWPPTKQVEVSSAARRATMMSYKLQEEDIGKMEGEGRQRNYTHVRWADNVEPLWKQLEDKNGLLIPEVRTNLPDSILNCLPDLKDIHTDFSIFLQAVRDVPIDKVRRRTEDLKDLREIKLQLSSLSEMPRTTPPSPMSQITQQFASSSLHNMSYPQYTHRQPTQVLMTTQGLITHNPMTPYVPPNPTTPYVPPHRRQTPPHMLTPIRQQPTPMSSTDPFRDDGTTPRPPLTSFYQNLQNTPTPTVRRDDRSLTLAYEAVQNSKLYPNDDNGRQQYAKDLATWEHIYGKNEQMSFMKEHLPLTPGTVALGSQECYGCGQTGHTGKDCPLPEGERINARERGWRNYITKILFPIGNRGTPSRRTQMQQSPMIAQMNVGDGEVLEYDPYLYPIEAVTFHDMEQGNGQESRE